MKTTKLAVIGLNAALVLAGCTHPGLATGKKSGPSPANQSPTTSIPIARVRQTHVIKIDHWQHYEEDSTVASKPISASTNYWKLKENDGNGNGALRNMSVSKNDDIRWHLVQSEG